jgi:predicted glycosyltransferase
LSKDKQPVLLIYVTHLLGTGHLTRALAIAEACHAARMEVHLVTGGFPTHKLENRAFQIHQLPPCRVKGTDFANLFGDQDVPIDQEWRDTRADQLMSLTRDVKPDVLITELFPFGRRQMRFELLPLLDAVRAESPETLVLSSVRDILQPPTKQKKVVFAEQLLFSHYDGVLVHGDQDVARLQNSFPLTSTPSDMMHYTGYIYDGGPVQEPASDRDNTIIVSAGGGAAGLKLYQIAIEAAQSFETGFHWHILVGKNLPTQEFDKLRQGASEHITVEWARADFFDLLSKAVLSISQAGYNTVLDIISAGTPGIVVPFSDGGEIEQSIRADLFQQAKLLFHLPDQELSARKLAKMVSKVLGLPYRPRQFPNMNGTAGTVDTIRTLHRKKVK